jgi:hypothetical protein
LTNKNRNYVSGSNLEYRIIKHLKEVMGCDLVVRSAGSHGLADIIAFHGLDQAVWVIQVKKSEKLHDKHKSSQMAVIAGMCNAKAFEAWRENKPPHYPLKFKEITYTPSE